MNIPSYFDPDTTKALAGMSKMDWADLQKANAPEPPAERTAWTRGEIDAMTPAARIAAVRSGLPIRD
jgi:hypothetical protein